MNTRRYNQYIGKTVLVGISTFSKDETLINRYQYFGKIISIDDVMSIEKPNGEITTLPPDIKSLKKAQPGVYTLKSSGEQVENPDYTSMWSVYEKD